jgi:NADH dehydrogenase [ubiquinone] 1 alpha subcomplex assembly factor 5
MMGAGSLPALRAAMASTGDGTRGVARFHPAIDVRAAGDLLSRAGFVMPVAETETITARYRDGKRLLSDLRANGCSNMLAQRVPLSRRDYSKLSSALTPAAGDRVEESFAILSLTGWCPHSQAERPIE